MKETLRNRYKALFNSFESLLKNHGLYNRGFVYQYDDDEQGCDLLFVGINPSYTEKSEEESFSEYAYGRETARSYFKPFQEIHEDLKTQLTAEQYRNWTHIDWFVFRETDQELVKKLMKDVEGTGTAFLWEQLQIAKERVNRIAPKVMIVSNALAREFTGKNRGGEPGKEWGVWMDYRFDFDEEFGSWRINNVPELKYTHVLFSSMLSGQRALDLGSRERLVWQVKRILRNNFKD